MTNSEKVDILTEEINSRLLELRKIKDSDKGLRLYVNKNDIGSILNGYREGDIGFREAEVMLRKINGGDK